MTVPAARVVFDADDRAAVAAAVSEALATGALTLGPHTERFETAFATAHRSPHEIPSCKTEQCSVFECGTRFRLSQHRAARPV